MYNAVAKLHVMAEDGRSWIPVTEAMLGGGGGGGGAANDREFVVTTYRATAGFTGASIGDILTCTQILDVDGVPTTVSTIWRNQTTAADLGSAPSFANIELVGATALTNTQLRASAVSVVDTALAAQLPATLGTKTAAASLSVVPASDAAFPAAPVGYRSQLQTTRPANVTPYTAGDVVGGVLTFADMGAAGRHMMLTSCDMRYDVASLPAGMTAFRLHLYSATPPSALADNAAWDLSSGDRSVYIGFIDLAAPLDLGNTLFTQYDGVNKQFKLGAAETSVYGYLVTTGTYTPAANSEVFVTTLRAVML